MSSWRRSKQRDLEASEQVAHESVPPSLEIITSVPPLFCPECGEPLHAPIGYSPKFCGQCGHRLPGASTPLSGLDALLQSTADAKARGGVAIDPAGQRANVTMMGVSRTLMGVPRADLYRPLPARTRAGATRNRIQEARKSTTSLRTRSIPTPVPAPEPLQPKRSGASYIVGFLFLLFLTIIAASVTFWLCRRGLLTIPF